MKSNAFCPTGKGGGKDNSCGSGGSKSKPTYDDYEMEEAQKTAKKITGKAWSADDLVKLTGALDDSNAHVTLTTLKSGKLSIGVVGDTYRADVFLHQEDDGGILLYVGWMDVNKDSRGKGVGTRMVANMVDAAKKNGVDRIRLEAARTDDGEKSLNGYYTWARLGFDSPIPREVEIGFVMDKKGRVAKTVGDLMISKAGRDWWRENGSTFNGTMSLKKGSIGYRVFQTYRMSRGV